MSAYILPIEYFTFSAFLFASLTYASFIDLQHMEIPDLVSIGLFPAGAAWCLIASPDLIMQRLLGGIAALVLFYAFGRFFYHLRKIEGLGFGDIKLIASSAVWIGLSNLPMMILLASASGLIASFYRFGIRKDITSDTRIPFGPHLAASIWIVWFLTVFDISDVQLLGLFK